MALNNVNDISDLNAKNNDTSINNTINKNSNTKTSIVLVNTNINNTSNTNAKTNTHTLKQSISKVDKSINNTIDTNTKNTQIAKYSTTRYSQNNQLTNNKDTKADTYDDSIYLASWLSRGWDSTFGSAWRKISAEANRVYTKVENEAKRWNEQIKDIGNYEPIPGLNIKTIVVIAVVAAVGGAILAPYLNTYIYGLAASGSTIGIVTATQAAIYSATISASIAVGTAVGGQIAYNDYQKAQKDNTHFNQVYYNTNTTDDTNDTIIPPVKPPIVIPPVVIPPVVIPPVVIPPVVIPPVVIPVIIPPEDINDTKPPEDINDTKENTTTAAQWGLDRIDQRDKPLDKLYNYDYNGTGTHVYIIDSGIKLDHNEFKDRIGEGISFVDNDDNVSDCNGHGTHVSAIIAGSTYGVAKETIIHPVKIFDCNGTTSRQKILSAIDWVIDNHTKPAVVNMSISGSYSKSLNDAVSKLIDENITTVVAAGNNADDACKESPASEPSVITVASSTREDEKSYFSNTGKCVDIFAPGSDILTADIDSEDDAQIQSGTSMSAPHVTGVAIQYLEENPNATPNEITDFIINSSSKNKITDIDDNTSNRLLYSH
jgi:subtilisin family serine protease